MISESEKEGLSEMGTMDAQYSAAKGNGNTAGNGRGRMCGAMRCFMPENRMCASS